MAMMNEARGSDEDERNNCYALYCCNAKREKERRGELLIFCFRRRCRFFFFFFITFVSSLLVECLRELFFLFNVSLSFECARGVQVSRCRSQQKHYI